MTFTAVVYTQVKSKHSSLLFHFLSPEPDNISTTTVAIVLDKSGLK